MSSGSMHGCLLHIGEEVCYTEKSMLSNGYFLMSQGSRGSCLEGKLIAEFTKPAWNVCWSALGEDERFPFLGSEDASWLA